MVVLPIWAISSVLSVATTVMEEVPISPVYDSIQPPSGMAEDGAGNHRDSKKTILLSFGISSALIGGLMLCLCCLWIFRLNRVKNSTVKGQRPLDVAKGRPLVPILGKLNSLRMRGKKGNVSVYEYHVLEAATNNFEETRKIDGGGWGCVYKACIGENFIAAVKKLDGGCMEREFQNEVAWLSKIQHQNIVSLLGYCIYEESRFLVYEIMQNGSLESQLHGPSSGSALTWSLRMKIALDVARGLEYLHERCNPAVLHRDLKSSNILLDCNFNAKLSGFSLAVSVGTQNRNDLKISETSAYVAPEYMSDGKLTDKSDVYSFGVVLLELLTGRNPLEKMSPAYHQSILSWAMPQLTDRTKLQNIVDPVIRDKMDLKHLYQVAAVAVLCIQAEPSYRPLITDVLHSLIPLVPVELGGSLRVAENPKQ